MPTPTFAPTVSTIAETIQLSLSPVFMLAGVGSLLNVLAGRLSRVVDRARLHIGQYVAGAFTLAMVLLISSLVSFMVEVWVSLRAIHVRAELLKG